MLVDSILLSLTESVLKGDCLLVLTGMTFERVWARIDGKYLYISALNSSMKQGCAAEERVFSTVNTWHMANRQENNNNIEDEALLHMFIC